VRFLSAAAFEVVGFFVGAHVADGIIGPCNCDDPGLDAAIWGGSAGMVVGAGVGAALVNSGGCGFGQRLVYGIGGAFVGWGMGVTVGLLSGGPGLLLLPLSVPLGAVMVPPRCTSGA
jgi:hypothetical protein